MKKTTLILLAVLLLSGCQNVSENNSTDLTTSSAATTTTSSSVTEASDMTTKTEATSVSMDETTSTTPVTTEQTTASEPSDSSEFGTVGNGEKWAYFVVNTDNPLPDDYEIETAFVNDTKEMEKTAAYYCLKMVEAAKEDGIELKVLSAYRTIQYQQDLFDRNIEQRKSWGYTAEEAYADVAKNIALPGTSEHNAGLAADIVRTTDWDVLESFEDTEEFEWLSQHAQEYGFIMRYPKGKEDITGYIYEPWHYRFVGTYYAPLIKESGLCLEEYYEQYGNNSQ